jgi:hypothetical protein
MAFHVVLLQIPYIVRGIAVKVSGVGRQTTRRKWAISRVTKAEQNNNIFITVFEDYFWTRFVVVVSTIASLMLSLHLFSFVGSY